MRLLTPQIREHLLLNGAVDVEADHFPVVKFFDPSGAATWLATELDADQDTLFGLADLGFGFPELGSFSLCELQAVRLGHGLGIERDRYFEAHYPLSVYAKAARTAGGIVETEALLRAAAISLGLNSDPQISPFGTDPNGG
jgi:hypothetical protein